MRRQTSRRNYSACHWRSWESISLVLVLLGSILIVSDAFGHPHKLFSNKEAQHRSARQQKSILSNQVDKIGDTEGGSENNESSFFLRQSVMADVGRSSVILADGFFRGKVNFLQYQWERFVTFLSLESTFPSPNTYHQVFVACDQGTGIVVGMAEVDARNRTRDSTSSKATSSYGGPYMCNLAVDLDRQRSGIGAALVEQCEAQVQEWVTQSEGQISSSLYLKVRASNQPAILMYDKLGYQNILQEREAKTGETILVMRKQLLKVEPCVRSEKENSDMLGRLVVDPV